MIKITAPNSRQDEEETTGEIAVSPEVRSEHSHDISEQSTLNFDDIIEIPDTDKWAEILSIPHSADRADSVG